MEQKTFTCVQCPLGCLLTVEVDGSDVIAVSGNTCGRGEKYGRQEAIAPERMVTSLVNVENDFRPISVKTSKPVPKEVLIDIVRAIRSYTVQSPVYAGDIVIKNVLQSGIDVIATSSRF